MPQTVDLHFRLHYNLTPLPLTFPRGHLIPTPILPRLHSSFKLKLTSIPLHCNPHVTRRNLAGVFASGEEIVGSVNENDDEDVLGTEDDKGLRLEKDGDKKMRDLKNRLVFGIGIGVGAGGIVLTGGLLFAVCVAVASFTAAREYFEMVRNHGILMGVIPPPRYVSQLCSSICILMPLFTLRFVNVDVSASSSAFVLAMALILQREKPRFTQLSSTIFGLFYCGYLPCFWVKLRCSLAVPSINTKFNTFWPVLFGGPTHWTVGLCATLISISSIIAADTFAFLGGKFFGHTPLTNISPNKTLEGAFAGLTGCVCTAVILSRVLCWPTSLSSAAAFGILNFVGSLSGDLIESIIKRDAGVKDSGSLIPGHGGILDRVDSYVFTGALSFSFVMTSLPLFGV